MGKFSKIFFLSAVIFSITNIAMAQMTTTEYLDSTYLKNAGYSSETTRIIELKRTQSLGEEVPDKQESPNRYLRWINRFLYYIDPAQDDGNFGRHEIRPAPSSNDL